MDIESTRSYLDGMRGLASFIAVLFVAVFAAGTAVHAVSANTMALDMAMAEGGTVSMPDCQGCSPDGKSDTKASCGLACTAPAFAVPEEVELAQVMMPLQGQGRLLDTTLPRGLRTPPEPSPPRTLI